MATISLADNCLLDSMVLKGTDGMFEVTKDEVEISPFVASHYFASDKVIIVFTESDRAGLTALPTREMSFLATALDCEIDVVVSTLLPKKTLRPKKKKPAVVEEVLEDE